MLPPCIHGMHGDNLTFIIINVQPKTFMQFCSNRVSVYFCLLWAMNKAFVWDKRNITEECEYWFRDLQTITYICVYMCIYIYIYMHGNAIEHENEWHKSITGFEIQWNINHTNIKTWCHSSTKKNNKINSANINKLFSVALMTFDINGRCNIIYDSVKFYEITPLWWKHRHVMHVRTTQSTCFKIKQDGQFT
jgi:hypothetical protein